MVRSVEIASIHRMTPRVKQFEPEADEPFSYEPGQHTRLQSIRRTCRRRLGRTGGGDDDGDQESESDDGDNGQEDEGDAVDGGNGE